MQAYPQGPVVKKPWPKHAREAREKAQREAEEAARLEAEEAPPGEIIHTQ